MVPNSIWLASVVYRVEWSGHLGTLKRVIQSLGSEQVVVPLHPYLALLVANSLILL